MSLSILLSPPGTGLRQVETKLRDLGNLHLVDVEDELIGQPGLWDDPRFRLLPTRNIRELLGRLTRAEVMGKWEAALLSSLDQLAATESDHKVLAFHPSLFTPRRSEHFSTLGYALKHHDRIPTVDQVVLIVDDIFDMWVRLSGSATDLYNQDWWLRQRPELQKLRRLSQDPADPAGEPTPDPAELLEAIEGVGWSSSINILSQLLGWRHIDMIAAEALADALGCRLTILGVKHPLAALQRLVTENARTIYLSHPISRPRRTYAATNVWPEVVSTSNALGERFAARGTVLVCPTAIDEYRLAAPPDMPAWRHHERTMQLSDRWPALTAPSLAIEAGTPSSDLIHVEHDPARIDPAKLSVFARTLEDQIYTEVPFRDHFLVEHTDAMFVFRPLYEAGEFSGGVESEIGHWANAVALGETHRRAVFAHTGDDLQAWVDRSSAADGDRPQRVSNAVRDALRTARISQSVIDQLLTGRDIPSDMLDAEPLGGVTQEQFAVGAYRTAGQSIFYQGLTGLPDEFYSTAGVTGKASIVILEADTPNEHEMDTIVSLLTEEADVGGVMDTAYQSIESIIGSSLEEWVRSQLHHEAGRD